jgi:5-methylcytosine-specific restriction endonuclease McrA
MTSVAHDPATPLTKRCRRCDVTQPIACFGKRSASPDGLHPYCRVCSNAYMRESNAIKRGQAARFRVEQTDRKCSRCFEVKPLGDFAKKGDGDRRTYWCKLCFAEYSRRKYATDPALRAHKLALTQKWRADDPERARLIVERYRANRTEAYAANAQRWRAANPERAKATARASTSRRRAKTKGAKVVAFTTRALADRMAYFGNRCWMCLGPFEHVDHVKPLSKGGLHMLANLRPACSSCNNRKHAKWYGPQELHRFIKN